MSQESILGPYLKPGTPIKVGTYSTKIIRYLSEGGFSHVYTAKLDIPVKGSDVAVLKRIVAPDKHALAAIRTEVETMKKLKGHRYIVTYIDSHASALATGGFEVYVLMEYCPGGGLIDFMNTRLQTRLAEWEVLKIISDTTEAVACMHYLRPPLLHRDLKIENVLISGNGDYKLCDFGSCTEPRPPATNSQERRDLEDDIQKNTTIQYRSPEMVDVSRRLPIDEKSDIWALGVLLYKLCYFTTPFESQGQLAILNAAYTFPPYPPYTDRTKRLIAVTLQENPRDRPNIYQLLAEICAMRNVPVPIPDIYSKSRSSSQNTRSRPNSRPPTAHNDDILTYEAAAAAAPKTPVMEPVAAKEPMRRGRPERTTSPVRQEPLGTLQNIHATNLAPGNSLSKASVDEDEFTTKFPSLEEMDFSLDDAVISRDISDRPSGSARKSFDVPTEPSSSQALLGVSSRHPSTDEIGRPQIAVEQQASRPLPNPPVQDEILPDSKEMQERTLRPSEVGKTGTYIRQLAAQQFSETKLELKNTDRQQNNDTSIPSSGPVPIVRPKPIHLERPQGNDSGVKTSSNPYDTPSFMNDRLKARPQMISRSSQTSPKPKQAMQTQTSPAKNHISVKAASSIALSENLMRDSSGYVIKKPGLRPEAAAPKPQFKYSTSIDRPHAQLRAREQTHPTSAPARTRPQTVHLMSSSDIHRSIETNTMKSSDPLVDNRTGTSLDSNIDKHSLDRAPPQDNDVVQSTIRRTVSASASAHRHNKRPSLNSIPSFSGAAKNIMSGKFSDAFKKFETSGKAKGTTPAIERSNPLQVAENDLPEHITKHLQTAEARRSSSYSRSRPSFDSSSKADHQIPILEKSSSVESTSTSVKDAMKRLKEKANQAYVPQRSAQGYGKYTEPEAPARAATVVPYARENIETRSKPKSTPVQGKNARRYGFRDEDDDSASFSKRYPSLSDFKV